MSLSLILFVQNVAGALLRRLNRSGRVSLVAGFGWFGLGSRLFIIRFRLVTFGVFIGLGIALFTFFLRRGWFIWRLAFFARFLFSLAGRIFLLTGVFLFKRLGGLAQGLGGGFLLFGRGLQIALGELLAGGLLLFLGLAELFGGLLFGRRRRLGRGWLRRGRQFLGQGLGLLIQGFLFLLQVGGRRLARSRFFGRFGRGAGGGRVAGFLRLRLSGLALLLVRFLLVVGLTGLLGQILLFLGEFF